MDRTFLLINMDEVELLKKLNFNTFLHEYIVLKNSIKHNSCQCCYAFSLRKLKRKKHSCRPNEEIRMQNRDLIINSVLSNRSVILLEKDLLILQEMVENRWETLNKIDIASKNE